jgi:hypothetical protein
MRFLLIVVLVTFTSGCQLQSPLVPEMVRNYEGQFDLNGESYDFKYEYLCYYERPSWIFAGGAFWHRRNGELKIISSLSNGAKYQIQPIFSWSSDDIPCVKKDGPVESRLFIELSNGRVASFDKADDAYATFTLSALSSRISPVQTTFAKYQPPEKKGYPQTKKQSTSYYSVWISEFASNNWSDLRGHGIREYIANGKIPRLKRNKEYPFFEWSDTDVAFAREHFGSLRWPQLVRPLLPDASAHETWKVSNDKAAIWVKERISVDDSEKWGSATLKEPEKFNRWTEYRGARIEVPLRSYYRLLYDEERNLLIKIYAQRVELW